MTQDASPTYAQKAQELADLRARVAELERELDVVHDPPAWAPRGFYTEYYATTGFLLGAIAAVVSLVTNVIGAPIAGKSPLEVIRVYLTFPLGERALELASQQKDVYTVGDGVILAVGCCLYIGTGMVLGIPFYILLVWFSEGKSLGHRLVVASVLSLGLWVINFYFLLSWIQPALIGGNWITDGQHLPAWVAAATHLVFGWTMAVVYPWGRFQPYQLPATSDAEDTPV